jgi:hypothetical protein
VAGRTEPRILIAIAVSASCIALGRAARASRSQSFGKHGRVDLQAGSSSARNEDRRFVGFNAPPMIVGNVGRWSAALSVRSSDGAPEECLRARAGVRTS